MLNKTLLESWLFFRTHAMVLSAIILPIVIPISILTSIYEYFFISDKFVLAEALIPMFINLLASPIYSVGVILYMASVIGKEPIDIQKAWVLGIKFWAPFLVLTVIVGAAVMTGFIFFIIPGIYLTVRFSFSGFDLLLKENNPLNAIKNSWDMTKEYTPVLIAGYVLITLSLYIPYYTILSTFHEANVISMVLNTIINLIYSVLGTFFTIFSFRIYDIARKRIVH